MNRPDRSRSSASGFEQQLIASARGDAMPQNVQAAWTEFIGAAGLVAGVEAGTSVAPPPHPAAAPPPARAAGTAATHGAALTWALVGALAGAGATAGWMWPHSLRPPPAPFAGPGLPTPTASSAVRAPAVTPAAAPSVASRGAGSPPTPRAARRPVPGSTASAAATPVPDDPLGDQLEPSPPTASAVEHRPPSTLAAEVSLLDRARAASRAGAHDEAVRLVEAYHRDFPDGALAPDAEVVAIEALAATDRRVVARRRALQFLEHYPTDPHAPRVKRLLER